MSTKALRGIKRFCQSEECGLPFYDLNRADIACPNCGSVYVPPPVIEITAETLRRVSAGGRRPGRTMFQPSAQPASDEPTADAVADTDAEVTEDDLGDVEVEDDAIAPVAETMLETDDEAAVDLDAPRETIKDD